MQQRRIAMNSGICSLDRDVMIVLLLPRDPMHRADYVVASLAAVCPSHVGIRSKRLNVTYPQTFSSSHHSSFTIPNITAIF